MGRPKGSKNGQTTLGNNVCQECGTRETPQWYTGPLCKPCYRKNHRAKNIEIYKAKDARLYEENRDKKLDRQKKYYEEHRDQRAQYRKKYYEINGYPDRKDYSREYRRQNPDVQKLASQRYAQRHPERLKESYRRYQSKNLAKYAARAAFRRARKLLATPKWLTEEHKKQMAEMYDNCPKGYDVDHIIPLISDFVCGLHVPWNLQHLESSENRRKGNRIIQEKGPARNAEPQEMSDGNRPGIKDETVEWERVESC